MTALFSNKINSFSVEKCQYRVVTFLVKSAFKILYRAKCSLRSEQTCLLILPNSWPLLNSVLFACPTCFLLYKKSEIDKRNLSGRLSQCAYATKCLLLCKCMFTTTVKVLCECLYLCVCATKIKRKPSYKLDAHIQIYPLFAVIKQFIFFASVAIWKLGLFYFLLT